MNKKMFEFVLLTFVLYCRKLFNDWVVPADLTCAVLTRCTYLIGRVLHEFVELVTTFIQFDELFADDVLELGDAHVLGVHAVLFLVQLGFQGAQVRALGCDDLLFLCQVGFRGAQVRILGGHVLLFLGQLGFPGAQARILFSEDLM